MCLILPKVRREIQSFERFRALGNFEKDTQILKKTLQEFPEYFGNIYDGKIEIDRHQKQIKDICFLIVQENPNAEQKEHF